MEKKVVVLGAKGMLGQALVLEFEQAGYTVAAWDREEIDITDFPLSEKKLAAFEPAIVINAAAYNAVDLCEDDDEEYQKALVLNRDVPGFLAEWGQKQGVMLVHYSTDYVFDGTADAGYPEDAAPKPLSRYGESKYAGERAVLSKGDTVYLIRLSKLFGAPATSAAGKKSFFEIMLAKGRSEEGVKAVDDERSAFTYAPDLARATRELVESGDPYGIYHLPNEGGVTWYEAVGILYAEAGIMTPVTAVSSDAFPRPAKRPHTSVLKNTKRPKLRPYTEALKEFLEAIK